MRGHLRARGHNVQWDRIRDSMRRLCPEEILMRALHLTALRRRTYRLCPGSSIGISMLGRPLSCKLEHGRPKKSRYKLD